MYENKGKEIEDLERTFDETLKETDKRFSEVGRQMQRAGMHKEQEVYQTILREYQ